MECGLRRGAREYLQNFGKNFIIKVYPISSIQLPYLRDCHLHLWFRGWTIDAASRRYPDFPHPFPSIQLFLSSVTLFGYHNFEFSCSNLQSLLSFHHSRFDHTFFLFCSWPKKEIFQILLNVIDNPLILLEIVCELWNKLANSGSTFIFVFFLPVFFYCAYVFLELIWNE